MKQITKSEFSHLEAEITNKLMDKMSGKVSGSAVFAVMLTVLDAFRELTTELFDSDELIEIVTDKEQ